MKKRLAFIIMLLITLSFSACNKSAETAKLEEKISALESEIEDLKNPPATTAGAPVIKDEATGIDYSAIVKDIMSTVYGIDMDNLTAEQKDEENVNEYVSVDYDMNYYWRRDVVGNLKGFNVYYKGDQFQLIYFEKESDLNNLVSIWGHWEPDANTTVDIYKSYPYGMVLETKHNNEILKVVSKYINFSS